MTTKIWGFALLFVPLTIVAMTKRIATTGTHAAIKPARESNNPSHYIQNDKKKQFCLDTHYIVHGY